MKYNSSPDEVYGRYKRLPADEVYCEGCVLGTGYATCLQKKIVKSSQLIASFVVFNGNATIIVLDQWGTRR